MSEPELRNGSIVRITSPYHPAWVGPVHSHFSESVYDDELDNSRPLGFNQIGHEVAGIEMYDITRSPDRAAYYYWKVGDPLGPHKVEIWEHEHPGEWVQIYPRTIGGWTFEEQRQASK